jgi:hypothetical protein
MCLIKDYAMKTYGGVDVYIHIFLTSVLAGGKWPASGPGRFTPGERAPGTLWIGGWVDPPGWSGRHGKVKILVPTGTELRPLGRQPVASRYTDSAFQL